MTSQPRPPLSSQAKAIIISIDFFFKYQIEVPDDLLKSLSIVGNVTPDGADFSGAEMIYNYERLLRQVRLNEHLVSHTLIISVFFSFLGDLHKQKASILSQSSIQNILL